MKNLDNLMNEKKFYEEPMVEIIEFNLVNVITESGEEDYGIEQDNNPDLPFNPLSHVKGTGSLTHI